MSVQILGLREYKNQEGEIRTTERFFNNNWRASSVRELFSNIDHYIEIIGEPYRYNLYYTAADVMDDKKGRILQQQDIIPFDVDDIDYDRRDEYPKVVCDAIGADIEKCSVIMTGNGIQVIVETLEPITYDEYFEEHRALYKAICTKIDIALNEHLLDGKADVSVWSPARLLRLPLTENRKEGKPRRMAYFMVNNLEPQDYDLIEKSGLPVLEAGEDYVSDRLLSKFPDPDPEAVQQGCEFLKNCKENPNSISEPQWYAMLSILARLPNGDELCHEYSQDYDSYNEFTTQKKLEQARTSSGPRTCANINTLWEGCGTCANWGKCKSPVQLTGVDHISTRYTGFYKIALKSNGDEIKIPDYDGLLKFYEQHNPFVTHLHGKMNYVYSDGVWRDEPVTALEGFAEEHFDPSPSNHIVAEFKGKIRRRNLKDQEWFENTEGFVNFSNGVLNLETRETVPHSTDFPFQYKLPFAYDPTADCPRFEQYLDEVTKGDVGLNKILIEFMGYTLAGINPELGQKALILSGEGSNGKSVFLDLLKYMAGEGNYSSLYMGHELAKMENRYQLDGKLFNVSEEVPSRAFADSSLFKSLVTGGEVQARKLYCDSYSMRTRAKIIMACNELPSTTDTSHGIMRRLLIVPFNRKFTEKDRDIHLRPKLFAEASGIFNLALKGLDTFLRNNQFTDSDTARQALIDYQEENDPLLLWFKDNFTPSSSAPPIKITEFYNMYKFAMVEQEEKPFSMTRFGRRMKQIIGEDYSRVLKVKGVGSRVVVNYRKLDVDNNTEEAF